MKRFSFNKNRLDELTSEEYVNGEWINIKDCIIAEQDNMMMGDSLSGLNEQITKQTRSDGPSTLYDVMIIMRRKDEKI